jgi:Mce-associated membrane protein
VKSDDSADGERSFNVMGGEAGVGSTAIKADLNGSGPSKGKAKGTKKSKKKSAKSPGSSAPTVASAPIDWEAGDPDHRTNGSGDTHSEPLVIDTAADTMSSMVADSVVVDPAGPEPVADPVEPGPTAPHPAPPDLVVSDPATSEVDGDGQAAEADETGPPAVEPSSTGRGWARSNIALIGGGVVIVALAVALLLSLLALGNQDASAGSRTSALATARTDAVQLASYNYRSLNRDFGAVVAESTPSFRRSFTESSNALKSTLTKYKATADATVVSAGLVSASPSRAVVLVFLDQKIANATQASATTDRSQVEITLVSSGGKWLIDQVTLL